jgi:hypothetical protein
MPGNYQGRLLALALRCYPPTWRARHGDEARELAVLLAQDGVPPRSMAWNYLKGAAMAQLIRTRTTRRLRTGVAALVTATSLAAVSLLVSIPPAPAGAAGVVRADITSRADAGAELTAVFKSHHFDIGVQQLPGSPSLVGSILATKTIGQSTGSNGILGRITGTCAGGAGACTQGLLLPSHFSGQMLVLVGRVAGRGEKYAESADVFRPGELLSGTSLFGSTVEAAVPVLRTFHVDVLWKLYANNTCSTVAPGGRYHLTGGFAISAGSICLEVTPSVPSTTLGQG